VLEAVASRDPFARRVHDAWRGFRDEVRAWHAISEVPYYQASGAPGSTAGIG